MKQASKSSKQRKQHDRAPAQRAGVTELSDQDLEQVQGGTMQNDVNPQLDQAAGKRGKI